MQSILYVFEYFIHIYMPSRTTKMLEKVLILFILSFVLNFILIFIRYTHSDLYHGLYFYKFIYTVLKLFNNEISPFSEPCNYFMEN